MIRQSRKRSMSFRRHDYFECLEQRTLLSGGPDLAVSILNVTGPGILVPGDKGNAKIQITNGGDAAAVGTIYVGVFASADTSYHLGDVRLGGLGIGGKSVNLAPNKSITLSIPLVVGSDVLPGTYHLVVKEISTLSITDTNSANSYFGTAGTSDVEWAFGTVGARKNVALTLLDGANAVKFSLSGLGTGQISNPTASFAALDVAITGTTAASGLTISTPAKTFTSINAIHVGDTSSGAVSLGRISAATTNIERGISVTGLASAITVHNIQSLVHYISLNTAAAPVPASAKVKITANSITGCNVDTGGIPIGTFAFFQANSLNITAPTVQAITVTDKVKTDTGITGALTISRGTATVPAGAKVNISANTIDHCVLDTGDLPIGTLSAYKANTLTLTAPYVQSMSITDKAVGDVALSGSITVDQNYGSDLCLGKLTVAGDVGGLTLNLDEGGSSSISVRSWDGGHLTATGTVAALTVGGAMNADVSLSVGINKATINGGYTGHWTGNFGSLTVKGDLSDSTFDIGPHAGGFADNQFNSLAVTGWIDNTTITAANPVGTISAGGLRDSSILIGVKGAALPAVQGDFETHHTGTIKSLTVTGIKVAGHFVDSIARSNIAAWQITTLKLAPIDTDNSGTPFGIAATSIKTFTYRHLSGTSNTSTNLIDPVNDSFTDGDFALRIL